MAAATGHREFLRFLKTIDERTLPISTCISSSTITPSTRLPQ
jgi:hypothetical protein